MEVFRLTRKKYSSTLSGVGASLRGARWNSVGVELIYAASNRALALAEVAVHVSVATLPGDFVMVTIDIPDDISVGQLKSEDLPPDWNIFPYTVKTQRLGDTFVSKNENCLLRVPSAVVKGEFNLLINPNHPDFGRVRITHIEDFAVDRRLFG